jgi:death-on-curing protein
MTWVWIDAAVVGAIHEEQLAEHGGATGLRDPALLEAALARPLNLDAYGTPDACDLAAAYAFGIARNHAFVDGNKRTALVVAETFLVLNGHELTASDAECVSAMLALAGGDMDAETFAAWLRANVQPT